MLLQVIRIAYGETKSSEAIVDAAKKDFDRAGYTNKNYRLPSSVVETLKLIVQFHSNSKRQKTSDTKVVYELVSETNPPEIFTLETPSASSSDNQATPSDLIDPEGPSKNYLPKLNGRKF